MTSTTGVPIAAALLVGALLAGCGSGSAGVTQPALRRALKAAACLRANGVPNYPEPKFVDGTIALSFTAGVNPTTPAVQTAAEKCGYQAEQQAGETSSRIAFVRCMREHGVRDFPYPTATGHVSPALVRAAGININSAAVTPVVVKCLPPWLLPGKAP